MKSKLILSLLIVSTFCWADNSVLPSTTSTSTAVSSSTVESVVSTDTVSLENAQPSLSTATVAVKVSTAPEVPIDHIENTVLRRFVGEIETIDPDAHRLVIKGRDGKTQEFILTERTRAMSEDGHRLHPKDLKAGDKVSIRYVENYNYVRKIDRL